MNDFTAKKLGEVLAFARVLALTLDRGGEALAQAIAQNDLEDIRTANEQHIKTLETGEPYSDVRDALLAKADKTAKKLTAMQDLYLADEDDWDDPAELMEWLGFFEGAAMVHWNLVIGAAHSVGKKDLTDLAESGVDLHTNFLVIVANAIQAHGAERASK